VLNQFDFTNLGVGSLITARFDFDVTTTQPNQEFEFDMQFAIGGTSPFTLVMNQHYVKSVKLYHIVFTFIWYIGSDDVRLNPAKVLFRSTDNASIRVNGWFVDTFAI